MRRLLIALTALLPMACATPSGPEPAGAAAAEQIRLACARIAGTETDTVYGAHGRFHPAEGPYYLHEGVGGIRETRPVFRDPYFNPADSRFRQQVYTRCLQQKG